MYIVLIPVIDLINRLINKRQKKITRFRRGESVVNSYGGEIGYEVFSLMRGEWT